MKFPIGFSRPSVLAESVPEAEGLDISRPPRRAAPAQSSSPANLPELSALRSREVVAAVLGVDAVAVLAFAIRQIVDKNRWGTPWLTLGAVHLVVAAVAFAWAFWALKSAAVVWPKAWVGRIPLIVAGVSVVLALVDAVVAALNGALQLRGAGWPMLVVTDLLLTSSLVWFALPGVVPALLSLPSMRKPKDMATVESSVVEDCEQVSPEVLPSSTPIPTPARAFGFDLDEQDPVPARALGFDDGEDDHRPARALGFSDDDRSFSGARRVDS